MTLQNQRNFSCVLTVVSGAGGDVVRDPIGIRLGREEQGPGTGWMTLFTVNTEQYQE